VVEARTSLLRFGCVATEGGRWLPTRNAGPFAGATCGYHSLETITLRISHTRIICTVSIVLIILYDELHFNNIICKC
jgi:hypothetical protein